MNEFWILIFVSLFATNSLDKAESVKLKETPLNPLDEIFGEGWWDKDKAEEWHKLTLEHNFHHQIDRQNTQLGEIELNSTDQNPPLTESEHSKQIEPNSTDQNPPLTESDHSGQIEPNSTDQNPPLTESDHPGQIEPNSTDQNPPLTESDHPGQIEPNSTDQNPPLTESDHSDNAKNSEEQNKIIKEITSNNKRKIIDKFHAIKDEFKLKGKFSAKEWVQIENKIAKHLKVNRSKIYKWKKKKFGLKVEEFMQKGKFSAKEWVQIENKIAKHLKVNCKKIYKRKKKLGLNQFYEKEERKHLVEKFDQKKALLKRDGFKNSQNELDKTVAKKLGLSYRTIYRWKNKLGQIKPQHKHTNNEQNELMKIYYEIKDNNPKISDEKIAKRLKISRETLCKWKKQFKRQLFHPNSVDGHSVEENDAENIQEIENSNSENI